MTDRGDSAALDEHKAKSLLKTYNVPIVQESVSCDEQGVVDAAGELGYPVVVKGAGRHFFHKTEKNLVHVHLTDEQAVRKACRVIREQAGDAFEFFIIQPHISGHREFLAGYYRDAAFGPVIVFGLGGVLTQALNDVVLRLGPLNAEEANDMLSQIRATKLLGSYRCEAPVQREDIVKTLMGLSRLSFERPEIEQIDINPLKITPQGEVKAVDALITMSEGAPDQKPGRRFAPAAIQALFHPKSIAFVGASAQLGKWGHLLVVNTISGGFKGDIYLVNPKGGTIAGRPVYKNIADIPGPVDLAVVTIPAQKTRDLVAQCKAKAIANIVIISSGFGETGAEGKTIETRLAEESANAGILTVGPNTMGITNPHIHLFCTGITVTPIAGSTTMISQSGNMGTQLLAFMEKQGIGIRCFVGSGNEAMLTIEDYLEGFEQDNLTRTILLYLEGIANGRRFFENASRISRKKPIVLLKGGRTSAGKRAAESHTGAMASNDRVFDAMCRQAGILKVEQSMDMLDLVAALDSLPLPAGPRTAIITWGGGWGVVTADLCQASGLELPQLDSQVIRSIDKLLPSFWSRTNPVDLVGSQNHETALKIMKILMKWEGCDAVISLGIAGRLPLMSRMGESIIAADPTVSADQLKIIRKMLNNFETKVTHTSASFMQKYNKPIINVSLLAENTHQTVYKVADSQYKSVVYETPERAAKTLSKMVDYRQYLIRTSKI
ncbi:MAG: CoA-binding protein [Desulfobacteraceae bacterium]|nr:CoA-binding protein [Desulfobacteraceae bacterium]